MYLAILSEVDWSGLDQATADRQNERAGQKARILAALGVSGSQLPRVDDEMVRRHYRYLSKHLVIPFEACYPGPVNPDEESLHRCTVVELLDPAEHADLGFSGLHCRVRRQTLEVILPLIDLQVPEAHPSFQKIEDFWYWFWNWR